MKPINKCWPLPLVIFFFFRNDNNININSRIWAIAITLFGWWYSPVKIWEDPPLIATKTKWPPSCRKFCVDFKNKKFTKINRVEPFQISHYILGTWGKLLKKNSNMYFFHNYEKYIFVYNQYGLYLFPYPIQDNMDGWMANYQTIWRITHRNMQIQGKIFFISSYFTR